MKSVMSDAEMNAAPPVSSGVTSSLMVKSSIERGALMADEDRCPMLAETAVRCHWQLIRSLLTTRARTVDRQCMLMPLAY